MNSAERKQKSVAVKPDPQPDGFVTRTARPLPGRATPRAAIF